MALIFLPVFNYQMKHLLLTIALTGSLLGYSQKANKAPATPQTPSVSLKTYGDSVQYAAGVYIGKWIISNGFTQFDPNLFVSGINDRLQKGALTISDSAAFMMVMAYKQKRSDEMSRKLEADFFALLKDKPGLGKLPSGVQYQVRVKGTGIRPSEEDSIVINFKGALVDGTVFEDTYTKKISVATTPKTLMPGMNEAIQMMPAGSVWELYIPSEMAYGEKGHGAIPPNNAVIILVELVSVKRNS
jgi:FKBP-type peptidyl-prolyl cis-trans isomerase